MSNASGRRVTMASGRRFEVGGWRRASLALLSWVLVTPTGAAQPFEFGQVAVTTQAPQALSATPADLDGDGDQDVILVSLQVDVDSWTASWCPNLDGKGTFGPPAVLLPQPEHGGVFQPGLSDVDGDGDLDVVALRPDPVSLSVKCSWFENLGGATAFGPPHDIHEFFGSGAMLNLADIDGDGDDDVVIADAPYYTANDLSTIENLGGGRFGPPVAFDISLSTGTWTWVSEIESADIDGDGDVDLAISYDDPPAPMAFPASHRVTWYANTDDQGAFAPAQAISAQTVGSTDRIAVADIDGDGDPDIVAGDSADDDLRWFEQSSPGVFEFLPTSLTSSTALGVAALETADVDGDGDLDVLAVARTSLSTRRLEWHENASGTGSFAAPVPLSPGGVAPDTIALGDIEGDGDVDLISSVKDLGRVIWYQNPLASLPWQVVGPPLAGGNGVPLFLAQGLLSPGSLVAMDLSSAAPNAPCFLVAGLSQIQAPFKGGVLVPQPDVVIGGLQSDASGQLSIAGQWPAGVPAGSGLVLQMWVVDAGGPAGLAATSGLATVTH